MKWYALGFCVLFVIVGGQLSPQCKNAEDCKEGECCVNFIPGFGGFCSSLNKEGESCTPFLKTDEEKPDMYYYQCPCKEGLECVAAIEIKIFDYIIRPLPKCCVREKENPATSKPKPKTEPESKSMSEPTTELDAEFKQKRISEPESESKLEPTTESKPESKPEGEN